MAQQGLALDQRVISAAEAALERQQYVNAVDVLVDLGWLPPPRVDEWRQGRIECLEDAIAVKPAKLAAALAGLEAWATDRQLEPSVTAYVARTRDRRPLRFSRSGEPGVERSYSTLWVSPALSERARVRLQERLQQPPDLVVISPLNDWTCTRCAGSGDLLLMEDAGPLCMTCAEMDHLVFLPAGDAALTRRAKRSSGLSAVVVRFSRSRGRYERQGVLVEQSALEHAKR